MSQDGAYLFDPAEPLPLEADTAAGYRPSPNQRAERRKLKPGERCGFGFVENPEFDPAWIMSHCTELEEVGEEDACVGCEGYGVDCWSVWVRAVPADF